MRQYDIAEVVSALLGAGFRLTALDEHPDWTNPAIPGTYTLVAAHS